MELQSAKAREKLRMAFQKMFEDRGQLNAYMNLFDFAKMAGSILGLRCSVKEYFAIQLVEYHCDLFEEKGIEVFIEIDKHAHTYRYIKQKRDKRLDVLFGQGMECVSMSQLSNNISDSSFHNLL